MLLFIIVGLATGSAYAATRAGLVRPHKAFGAANFAHGAPATVPAHFFSTLHAGLVASLEAPMGWPRRASMRSSRTWSIPERRCCLSEQHVNRALERASSVLLRNRGKNAFDGPGRSTQPERGPARIPGVNLSHYEKGELAERRVPSEPEFSWIQ